jgi:uncharacterized repeat protein (TIGR01451 family)
LPVPIPSLAKQSSLIVDADGSGDVSRGDTLNYTVVLRNNGLGPLLNGVLTDTIPFTHTDFVVGSVAVSTPPPLGLTEYYSTLWGYPPTANPEGVDPAVRAFRVTWPIIESRQTITVTFGVRLQDDIPPDVDEISNLATFSSDDTGTRTSRDPTDPDPRDPYTDVPLGQPILQIRKLDEPDPIRPGQLLTYTIVVTNTGTATALGSLVLENLPTYVTYVSNTLNLTLPSVVSQVVPMPPVPFTTTFTGSYADDFDLTLTQTSNYTGSDGSLAWSTNWIEVDDFAGAGPAAGDVRVGSAGSELSPPGYLELTDSDDVNSGITRTLDLRDFVSPRLSFYVSGVTNFGDTYDVLVNGVSLLGGPERYNGPYQQRTADLSPFVVPPGVATLQFIAQDTMEATDVYRVENIVIEETSPLRTISETLETTTTSVTYTTQTGINPVVYNRVANTMTVASGIRIPPKAQVRFSFQVRVAIPLPNGMTLLNTAAITSTNVVTKPYPLTDTVTTTVLSDHVLTITKTDNPYDPVVPGQLMTYTLNWTVAGDEPAPNVVVTDSLPLPYVSYVRCDGGLSCSPTAPDTVVWNLGDRLPIASGITSDGGQLTLTVRVEQRPPGGVFTNTVIINDADPGTAPDTDDEPTTVLDASFVLSKRRVTDSPVVAGEPVQFLIVITNTGTLTITRLPLEDTYDPVYLEFQGALPNADGTSPGAIFWNDLTQPPGSDLAPGANTQILVDFIAITSTQSLSPPLTINTATSDGAIAGGIPLPPAQDDDDVEIVTRGPVAIELLYLRAGPKSGGILIEWATLFEIDTYGFWLYRSADDDLNHAVPVAFIASQGWLVFGASYQYLDTDLPSGLYHYWLVEVENSGKETTYGPVSAGPGWDEADLPHRIYLPVLSRD